MQEYKKLIYSPLSIIPMDCIPYYGRVIKNVNVIQTLIYIKEE